MSDFCEIKHTAWANYVEKCSQSTLVVLPFMKMKTVSRILGYQNYCLRICWKMLLIPSGFFFTFSENENDIVNITKSKTLPEIRQQMLNLEKMKTISWISRNQKRCLRYVNKCLTLGKWKRYRIGNIRKSKTLPEHMSKNVADYLWLFYLLSK